MRTRKRFGDIQYPRIVSCGKVIGERWVRGTGWVGIPPSFSSYAYTTNRYYDRIERCTDELHPGPPWKSGGPLQLVRAYDWYPAFWPVYTPQWTYSPNGLYRYTVANGAFCPSFSMPSPYTLGSASIKAIDSWSLGDISSLGAEAYAKFSPLKPTVDLGTFFGEYKEIPQMLKSSVRSFRDIWRDTFRGKSKSLKPSDYANEYLNTQFGWEPFLSTFADLYKAVRSIQKRIERLRQYNGKWERRGGLVSLTNASELIATYTNLGGTTPGFNSVLDPSTGSTGKLYLDFDQKVTFKGAYKYYVPGLDTENRFPPELITQLLGLRATPELVWNLTPWSWLVDWFANIGAILQNADDRASFQLVTKYAYLMGTTSKTYRFEGVRHIGGRPHSFCFTTGVVHKQRVGATPYGFGVQFPELSAWRLSILTALGLSKTRGAWSAGTLG